MSHKKATDEIFMEGIIYIVSAIGIENIRTKHVADYTGYTEATMYKRFPSKEILLRETFLYVDEKVSCILTQSDYIQDPGDTPFELALYDIWHDTFRYLVTHKEETIFLIRYRYSSFYTEEVESKRQAFNGGFEHAYALFEKQYGVKAHSYYDFLINYIFGMTLNFSEQIITGKIEDNQETEDSIWLAISNAVKSFTRRQGGSKADDRQGITQAQQTRFTRVVSSGGAGK